MSEASGIERDESEQLDKLAAALAKAQATMTHADKSREAPVTKDGSVKRRYATLADVMDACRPHLTANGLSISQHVSNGNGTIVVTSWLLHESGQWMRSRFAMPRSESNNVSVPQALGISISYARRYALAALVGVAVEDDDGADGSVNRPKRQERQEATPRSNNGAPTTFPNFGRAKGEPIRDAHPDNLSLYLRAAQKTLADPEKARYHDKERALVAAYEAEIARQMKAAEVAPPPSNAAPDAFAWARENLPRAATIEGVDKILTRAEEKVTVVEFAELVGLGRKRKVELADKALTDGPPPGLDEAGEPGAEG